MLEALAVVGAVLALMGVGAGTVYWGLSKTIAGQAKHIDGLNGVIKELEADNDALEDAHDEILAAWLDNARAADLPPAERIGMLLSFRSRRRQARDLSGASAVDGGQGNVGSADPEGSAGPPRDGDDPVRRPRQDPSE